jgi:hypothetical protein
LIELQGWVRGIVLSHDPVNQRSDLVHVQTFVKFEKFPDALKIVGSDENEGFIRSRVNETGLGTGVQRL